MKHKKIKDKIMSILFFSFSIICGIISKDIFLGTAILLSGLLCGWYTSLGKPYGFLFGATNYLLCAYVSYLNGLYGICFFSIIIYLPLQIHGFITWNKNQDQNKTVKKRNFTIKTSLIVTISCIIGSFSLGYLLTLIPGQQLALLDASSNALNLCGIILMNLRFTEGWWLWLANNVVDLAIWIWNTVNHGSNSIMMLIVSVGFLLLNIYGLVRWTKTKKVIHDS